MTFDVMSFPSFMTQLFLLASCSFVFVIFYTFAFSVPAIWVPVGMRFQKNLFLANLIFLLQGIMLSDDYIKIIKDGLLQSARDMGMGRWRWIFQQDNDPKVSNIFRFFLMFQN